MRASIKHKPKRSKGLIYPVILAGGAGTRLWPASTARRPKPFLPLMGKTSLLALTAARVARGGFAPPLFIVNRSQRDLLRGVGGRGAWRVYEPMGRNTAAAIAVGAHLVRELGGEEACMLALPADHYIAKEARFRALVRAGARLAQTGALVTFGIVPTHAHTGLGYIQAGARLARGARKIARFHEKPPAHLAKRWVQRKDFYWNSGMFLARAGDFLESLRTHAPRTLRWSEEVFQRARRSGKELHLSPARFSKLPNVPFDTAVMEKARNGAVLPADIGWSDIGSWHALWELAKKDANGNHVRGAGLVVGARNNYVRGGDVPIVLAGVDGLAVVQTDDAILIVPREQDALVKRALEKFQKFQRQRKPRR